MNDSSIETIIGECGRERMSLSQYHIDTVLKLLKEKGEYEFSDYLSEWEFDYLNRLKVPKRKADFISGRLAGKEAVLNYYREHGLEDIPEPGEINIRRTETGEPEILLGGIRSGLMVSITHSGNIALSLVCGRDEFRGVGIDAEKIEERDGSFIRIAFSDNEIKQLETGENGSFDKEKITLFWTLKEAVLKSIGSGLNLNLKDISIRSISSSNYTVELYREVEKRFAEVCCHGPFLKVYRHGDYMISISTVK
jgi:phosphopantetheine--protein transferase-like protein